MQVDHNLVAPLNSEFSDYRRTFATLKRKRSYASDPDRGERR